MSTNTALALKHLFARSRHQIQRDIHEPGGVSPRSPSAGPDLSQLHDDPLALADDYHQRMVRGRLHWSRKDLPYDVRLYLATRPAMLIADHAAEIAYDHGRLATLCQRLDEIELREGLQHDEYWPLGEGPDDYQQAQQECDELHRRVTDTVFTSILRRYQLDEIVELFESDRQRYDTLWEQGRHTLFGPLPEREQQDEENGSFNPE
jgi:hypothetical protein